MRKKVSLIIIVMLTMFIPTCVKAENRIYFDVEEAKIAPGAKKEVKIKVDSDSEFTKVNFNLITTSTYVGFYSVEFSEDFVRNSTSLTGSNYELEAKKPMKTGAVIGTITLLAKDASPIGAEGYIRVTKASITSSELINLPSGQVKMVVSKEKSTNNNLSSLSSSLATIEFNKDVLEYAVEVDSNTEVFDLSATAEDSASVVKISDQRLKKKTNVIKVTVTPEEGEEKVYKITVNKKEEKKKSEVKTKQNSNNTETKKENVKAGFIGTLLLLVIVLVLDLLYIKKKK